MDDHVGLSPPSLLLDVPEQRLRLLHGLELARAESSVLHHRHTYEIACKLTLPVYHANPGRIRSNTDVDNDCRGQASRRRIPMKQVGEDLRQVSVFLVPLHVDYSLWQQ